MSFTDGLSYALAVRANELLGDGEWHDYEPVVEDLIKLVPPGRAIRQSEKTRLQKWRKENKQRPVLNEGPPPRTRNFEAAVQIRSGARDIVRAFLRERTGAKATPGPFELTKRSGPPNIIDRGRKIRMVRTPVVLRGDPYRIQRDQLEYELGVARDRLDRFVAYLKDNGHAEVVDQLINGVELSA